eukprot:CAMPEP_0172511852 /NCGR_PEP_ID=MMETSP1066-20121228/239754_1 /TAXON_ID=671091 /ORGANISM="Coscinodiscus wailesii, Strain CCMP2513" /LENGTH=329 /DNA_ID=CAMNT_0013291407 /DNA_START=270 /DNA_END=1256 /DNA_ORIENTATION=+
MYLLEKITRLPNSIRHSTHTTLRTRKLNFTDALWSINTSMLVETTKGSLDQASVDHVREVILPFIDLEHPIPAKECPFNIDDLPAVTCEENVFEGKAEIPNVIVDRFLIDNELDVLEVRLNEISHIVDKFFIFESAVDHHGLDKPLIFERNKHQKRFSKFKDKIVHVTLDNAALMRNSTKSGIWKWENLAHQVMRRYFLNLTEQLYPDSDGRLLAVAGHVDEIPSLYTLRRLQQCRLKKKDAIIDIGTWMIQGVFDQVFRSDHPIPSFPYTFGNPAVGKPSLKLDRAYGHHARTNGYLLGGWHMTGNIYIPAWLLKRLSCTECHGNITK